MVRRKLISFYVNSNGCFICNSHSLNACGYPTFTRENKKTLIHRFIFKELYGGDIEGKVIRHKCDTTACINPEHLEVGTQAENIQDRVKRNRGVFGSKVTISVLKEDQVKEIKAVVGKMADRIIAEKYRVSINTIGDIRRGKTWKHI